MQLLKSNFNAYFAIFSIFLVFPSSIQSNELTQGLSEFSVDFYEQCVKSKPGNVIISPLSVAASLGLLSNAAARDTRTELLNGLHLAGDKATVANQFQEFANQLKNNVGNSTLSIANQIYVRQGLELNKNFQEVVETKYNAGVDSLNFADAAQSAKTINQFVEEKTNGKIKNLIESDDLSADTAAFLVNAVYFKGDWEVKFDKNKTREMKFYVSESESVPTEFMFKMGFFNHAYLNDFNASALELKYANSKLSFVIVLPNSRIGLTELETKLKNYNLKNIVRRMRSRKIDIFIPKFRVDYDIDLIDVLTKLGMATIFSGDANFSGLLDANGSLRVSKAIHKAIIEINEDGSEAAAATGVKIMKKMAPPKFKADHPFVYFIRDSASDAIIFSGRYVHVDTST